MSINNIQNKGLLWKLLQSNGFFNNLNNEHFKDIQNLFEATIENTIKTYPNESLVEANKIIIKTMSVELKKRTDTHPRIKIEDIKEQNMVIFDKSLENKEKEFKSLIEISTPKDVDFSDNKDAPFDGEINDLLEKAIAERENDLNVFVKQDISGGILEPSPNAQEHSILASEPTSELTSLNPEYSIKRKVTFKDITQNNQNSLETTLETLNVTLQLILENQKEIMKMIKK